MEDGQHSVSRTPFEIIPGFSPHEAACSASPHTSPKISELRQIRLFQSLSDAALVQIAGCIRRRCVEKGSILSLDQHLSQRMCFVRSGRYRLVALTPSGGSVTIGLLEPGDHFGELWVFSGAYPGAYNLIADSGGGLLEMTAKDTIRLFDNIPEFSRSLIASIAKLANSQAARIFEFACLDAGGRLQATLLRLAGPAGLDDQVIIDPAPTHAAIASHIGTTREGVTRHLRTLEMRGLIRTSRGRIVVLSLSRLRGEVERARGN